MNYTEITSRKNKIVLQAASLCSDKKARDERNLFVLEGIKLLQEAILSKLMIKELFFTHSAFEKYRKTIEGVSCSEKYLVTDEVYDKLSGESAPQGVFACCEKPASFTFTENEAADGSFVFLEDIQNPLNIGAVLRCCYSMGFEKVVFSPKCADIYSPKCARAAMGSLFKIKPFFASDMTSAVKLTVSSGKRVFCTMLCQDSKKLGQIKFVANDSFVIGNEGHGVSAELEKECTCGLYIPMNDGAESLNAATAAAIVMWEMKKDFLC